MEHRKPFDRTSEYQDASTSENSSYAGKRRELTGNWKGVILTFEEAPEYIRREHIKGGYLIGGRWRTAFWYTLFGLNNETFNAWTIIFGGLLATYLYRCARSELQSEGLPFTVFYLACILHTPFAVMCHCSIGVSERHRNIWRSADVFFILTCSVLRGLGLAWYVFSASAYHAYAAFLAAAYLSLVVPYFLLRPPSKSLHRKALLRVTGVMVTSYQLPVLVAVARDILNDEVSSTTFIGTGIQLCLILSAVLFGARIPERWRPGSFDFFGGHQIMHVLVIIEYALEWRLMFGFAQEFMSP